MFQLTINEKGGTTRQESFEKDEVTIGRVQGNDIILPKGNISKRHSRIVLKDGKFIIVDLKSTNGTYVNGKKITAPQVIKTSDKVYIGDFTIQIDDGAQNGVEESQPRRSSLAGAEEEIDLFDVEPEVGAEPAGAEAPGLIDENFDQEFDAPEPEPKAQLQRPEPAGPEPELELDEDFAAVDHDPDPPRLDLDDGFDPDPGFAPEPTPMPAAPSSRRAEAPSLGLEPDLEETPVPAAPPAQPEGSPSAAPPSRLAPASPSAPAAIPIPAPSAILEPVDREELLASLHAHIVDALDLKGRPLGEIAELEDAAEEVARARLQGWAGRLPPSESIDDLAPVAARTAVGIGPIEDLLADDAVFEVVLTPDRKVLADREGRLEATARSFDSDRDVLAAIHALAVLGGADPARVGPLVDVRLRNGARVLAALPPVAFRGPTLTVRKTTRDFFTLDKLREYDTIDGALLSLLDLAIRHRRNILLSIGPGVTATATLNAMLSQAAADERVVTAERGVELHLRGHANAVAFDLQSGVSVQDILRYAASAQTERVLFGELNEPEAAAVVEAFETTLDGGAAAIAAPSAEAAVARLSDWVAVRRPGGLEQARAAVAKAFPLVLQERKLSDSSRRITEVCELVTEEGQTRLEPVFAFEPSGVDDSMMITGAFVPTGYVPRFVRELTERGEAEFDTSVFET